jgi:hypothetical protein
MPGWRTESDLSRNGRPIAVSKGQDSLMHRQNQEIRRAWRYIDSHPNIPLYVLDLLFRATAISGFGWILTIS